MKKEYTEEIKVNHNDKISQTAQFFLEKKPGRNKQACGKFNHNVKNITFYNRVQVKKAYEGRGRGLVVVGGSGGRALEYSYTSFI